jgi:hypothetical protein
MKKTTFLSLAKHCDVKVNGGMELHPLSYYSHVGGQLYNAVPLLLEKAHPVSEVQEAG